MAWSIECGDSLDLLRQLPDACVDSIVTDPPYMLGDEPDIVEILTCWLAGKPYTGVRKGFMGKEWDVLPGPEYWRECVRVLKPGGHLLVFAGTRTQDLMGISVRLGGAEIRDVIAWLYGSGFPKSMDISKAIDAAAGAERPIVGERRLTGTARLKGGGGYPVEGAAGNYEAAELRETLSLTAPATPEAAAWAGWGTALKPANEPIIVARKPLDGTYAANVLRHGTGGLNIDACRIGMSAKDAEAIRNMGGFGKAEYDRTPGAALNLSIKPLPSQDAEPHAAGRWPANVVLSHLPGQTCPTCNGEGKIVHASDVPDDLDTMSDRDLEMWFAVFSVDCPTCAGAGQVGGCRRVGTSTIASNSHHPAARGKGGVSTTGHKGQDGLVERKSGAEEVEAWTCAPGCAVADLDLQSGQLTSGKAAAGGHKRNTDKQRNVYGAFPGQTIEDAPIYADTGGASRFFYVAKPSTAEREIGCHALPKKGAAELTDSKEGQARLNSPRTGAGRSSDGRGNTHPTVKPLDLIRYLIRLVTPPGGTVLDPFVGSGTHAAAAILEGFDAIGFELLPEHATIARARCQAAEDGDEVRVDPKTDKIKVSRPKAAA